MADRPIKIIKDTREVDFLQRKQELEATARKIKSLLDDAKRRFNGFLSPVLKELADIEREIAAIK